MEDHRAIRPKRGGSEMKHRIVTAAQMKAIEQAGCSGKYLCSVAYPIPQEELYVPHFRANCATCGSRLICNGCSNCGKCL